MKLGKLVEVDDLQVSCKFVLENSDLPNTSIIYTLFVGMAYTMSGTILICKTIPY